LTPDSGRASIGNPPASTTPLMQRSNAPWREEVAYMRQVLLLTALAATAFALAAPAFADPALVSDAESVPLYQFAILSDRTGGHVPGVYAQVIREINLLNPDFVITVGDHIEGYGEDYERSEAEWDSLLLLVGEVEAPLYLAPGNHDIWDDHSEEMYRRRTGFEPYFSFDHENTHFVVLDDSRCDVVEDFDDEQLDWLIRDLARNREAEHIFVFFHKPLWTQTLVLGNPDLLHNVFVEYGVDAVFCGHLHHYFSTEFDGIHYTVMGSSGGGMYRTEEQPVTRGEFFQFGWVSVWESDHELAIVHMGNIYPRSVVTSDDLSEIQRVESDLIDIEPIRIVENASLRAPVEVAIENVSERTIDDVIEWDVPAGWAVDPEETAVAVEPGSTGVYTFVMMNPGELYPTPRMTCRYPLSNGRMLDVDLGAFVMRSAKGSVFADPPVIDGDPSEACWGNCTPVTQFHAPYDREVEGDTEFAFACDSENLYISAICHDPAMVDLTAEIEERDGPVYSEDCVGYFFQPDPDEMAVYQIYVNPLGTVFDQKITFDETMWYTTHREWDGEYDIATQRADDRWSVEMRIPLEQMGGNVTARPAWRANFRRKQARTGAAADWQVPIDYDPGTFGELEFE